MIYFQDNKSEFQKLHTTCPSEAYFELSFIFNLIDRRPSRLVNANSPSIIRERNVNHDNGK